MKNHLKNYFGYMIASILFTLTFALVYGLAGSKGVIQRDTKITEQITFNCGDKTTMRLPMLPQFIGMDYNKFSLQYPKSKGWQVSRTEGNVIVSKQQIGLCQKHKSYRHLGISEGFLAVYEGPLGYNRKLLQAESIKIQSLPLETQKDLALAMKFNNQTPQIKEKLKKLYEFKSESLLNSAMENFDEFRE